MIRSLIAYERDPKSIYAASFATVRNEANLARFSPEMQAVVIRLIHACGMIEVADRIAYSAVDQKLHGPKEIETSCWCSSHVA